MEADPQDQHPQQLPSTAPQPLETPSPAVLKALEAEVKQLHTKLKVSGQTIEEAGVHCNRYTVFICIIQPLFIQLSQLTTNGGLSRREHSSNIIYVSLFI